MIDAHQHCWQIGAHDCTWPTPEARAIYRDFDVAELQVLAQPLGVTGSVLVQSQASDKDTDYLLELARRHDFVKAVVGWVDLAAASAPARINYLATQPKLRGLRPMLQSLAADDWISGDGLGAAIEAMLAARLCFDALVYVRHLPHIRALAERYPQLPIVIDHAAKPPIAASERSGYLAWKHALTGLAELPQVYCKVSGLVTEANAVQGADALGIYLECLLELFGAERLIWGSDWPVINAAPNAANADYAGWLTTAKTFFARLTAAERSAIFSGNARRFYRF